MIIFSDSVEHFCNFPIVIKISVLSFNLKGIDAFLKKLIPNSRQHTMISQDVHKNLNLGIQNYMSV